MSRLDDGLQLLNAGFLGKKSGKGFYLHAPAGKKEKGPRQVNPEALAIIKKHVKRELKLSTVGGLQHDMLLLPPATDYHDTDLSLCLGCRRRRSRTAWCLAS